MGNVRFDNFEWSNGKDPIWDEGHLKLELPITNPATGTNYIADNNPLYYVQPLFSKAEFAEYEALHPDDYARLPYGEESITFKLAFNYTDSDGQSQVWNMPGLIDLTKYTYGHWIYGRYQEQLEYLDINPVKHLHTDYFTYLVGSNWDPILEALLNSDAEGDYFLPVVLLMQDKEWYDQDPQSALAITTRKILKKLSINAAEVKEKFLEQEADTTNPDNNTEKWDFMLHFAVPINTVVDESIEYMYQFFRRMIPYEQYTFADYQQYLSTGGGIYTLVPGEFVGYWRWYKTPQPVTGIHITEGIVTGYDVQYGWSYIFERTFPGQYVDGDKRLLPGKCSSHRYEHKKKQMDTYSVGLHEMHGTDILLAKVGNDEEYGYHDYVIFTRQFAEYDAEGEILSMHYSRILVMALSQEYTINTRADQGSGGTGKGPHKIQKIDIGMFDSVEENTPVGAFRIPVNMGTLDDMPFLHKEPVLADALVYTVFLVHKEKVKFYEKGFFKIFIVIAAVILVVLVVSYGMWDIAAYLAGFLTASGGSMLLVYVIYFVLSFAIGAIIGMAGEAIGGTLGLAFAVIASILVATSGTTPGTLPGSFGNAVNYLNAASPYLAGGQQIYAAYVANDLEKDWQTFMLNARERQRQLDEAWLGLGTPNWLNAMDLVRASDYRLEKPGSWLARTKDPNPGVTAQKVVYNFTQLAKTLPESPLEKDIIQLMFMGFQQQTGRAT